MVSFDSKFVALCLLFLGAVAEAQKLKVCIEPFAGQTAKGKVNMEVDAGGNVNVFFKYQGLEKNDGGKHHVHAGSSCSSTGGVFKGMPDFTTNKKGKASGTPTFSASYGDLLGKVLVVHASGGKKLGCGVIGTSCPVPPPPKKDKLKACITPVGGAEAEGRVIAKFDKTTNDITYKYHVKGLEESSTMKTHIHAGTSCSSTGGLYYNTGTLSSNPWAGIGPFPTDASGKAVGDFPINIGYTAAETAGKVVVVHASTGAKIGCGVLDTSTAKC